MATLDRGTGGRRDTNGKKCRLPIVQDVALVVRNKGTCRQR